MTFDSKVKRIQLLLNKSGEEDLIGAYLDMAENEILSWSGAESISPLYDTVQITAVLAGYNMIGAENQTSHTENSISRSFKYSDMVDYIRHNVCAKAVVL
nr:MAG TPA: tail connector protein [Caudoviricetes sp.]